MAAAQAETERGTRARIPTLGMRDPHADGEGAAAVVAAVAEYMLFIIIPDFPCPPTTQTHNPFPILPTTKPLPSQSTKHSLTLRLYTERARLPLPRAWQDQKKKHKEKKKRSGEDAPLSSPILSLHQKVTRGVSLN